MPADAPVGATTIETFFGEGTSWAVTIPFTVKSAITVNQAVTATPTGQETTSFIPGKGIWYGLITNNTGSAVAATFTTKVTGPQGVVIYNLTAPGTVPKGLTTGIFCYIHEAPLAEGDGYLG